MKFIPYLQVTGRPISGRETIAVVVYDAFM